MGFILTLGAVGGIEASVSNEEMMYGLAIALFGLLGMGYGTMGLREY